MAPRSLTSANSILVLGITSLYSVPQQIQGFSTDDIYDIDPQEVAETMMGVDGKLSGGFVYVPVNMGITLQADSASNDIFDFWNSSQRLVSDIYYANGSITLPSAGIKYTLTRGILKTYPPIASAGRTLKARKYNITFESITPASIPLNITNNN